jgi:hypothetical protein
MTFSVSSPNRRARATDEAAASAANATQVLFTSFSRAGLFFVVAVVLMASTPWVLLQPDQEVRTELDRWFLTVAGSVDAITAGVLLALARRLRRTLLVLELAGAVIVRRRHHPSLPANIRSHPRNRRGAADRLSVLARREDVAYAEAGGYLAPQWSGIRLKTATMSSLALTTVDPVHGSLGEDEARPKLQGTGEG